MGPSTFAMPAAALAGRADAMWRTLRLIVRS
jgi:hypothetical protein